MNEIWGSAADRSTAGGAEVTQGRTADHRAGGDTLDDPYVASVREAARAAHVNVALPLVEREGDRLYNSLVPVTSDGKLLRPYRKMFPVPVGEISAGITPGGCNNAQEIAGVP